MTQIQNPVLKGFHPDPSMICVGEDWYLATSTFEWFPGVQLFHSRDLAHWERLSAPLQRMSQLNLSGTPDSGGVWAPNLSYSGGIFYLIYSNVHNYGRTYYDVDNYLVTAEDINGPWSEPIFLNSSGFDPALFHGPDGRKWFLSMVADYRPWKIHFAGIELQEYSESEHRLIGESKLLWRGSPRRTTEGPGMYYKDGWYYLFCAEGGTGVRHCEVVLRSRSIEGPYERSPYDTLITAWPYPNNLLQKSGHASIAEGPDGSWFLAHLCSRPVGKDKDCILGRETAIQALEWKEGWPYLKGGSDEPMLRVESPYTEVRFGEKEESDSWSEEFNGSEWDARLQTLRVPLENLADLAARQGWLRLHGSQSLESQFQKSLLAARQQHLSCRVDTCMEFAPKNYKETAGLVYYYDTNSHFYLFVTRDERNGRMLSLMCSEMRIFTMPIGAGILLPDDGAVYLRLETNVETAQFYYSMDGEDYEPVGPELNAAILSDDAPERMIHENRFTGAFVGLFCHDITGHGTYADFDYYRYSEKKVTI